MLGEPMKLGLGESGTSMSTFNFANTFLWPRQIENLACNTAAGTQTQVARPAMMPPRSLKAADLGFCSHLSLPYKSQLSFSLVSIILSGMSARLPIWWQEGRATY